MANANELFPGGKKSDFSLGSKNNSRPLFLDVQFSTVPADSVSGNGYDNHVSGRQNPLSVDVTFRGSRGASDDSLNVDKQIR